MTWELKVEELDIRAGYTALIDMVEPGPPRELGRESTEAVLVLVESTSGARDALSEVYVRTNGTRFERSDAPGSSAAVLTGWKKRAASITVHIKARVQDRYRVSVLWLKSQLWKGIKDTPCDMCKVIAKLLVRGVMAVQGLAIPGVGEAAAPLLELDFEKFFETVRKTPLWNWIVSNKLEMLAIALMGPLYMCLRAANAVESAVYAVACRILGACQDDGPRLAHA